MNTRYTHFGSGLLLGAALLGVATAFVPPAVAQCIDLPASAVSWWRAEGDAVDALTGSAGTLVNETTFGSGKVGQAFSLDNSNDYVDIGQLPELAGATEFTAMAWVYKLSHPGNHGFFGKWNSAGSGADTFLLHEQCGYAFHVGFANNSWSAICTGTSLPVGAWVHIAATWRSSDGAIRLYKDGVLVGSATGGIGQTLKFHTAYSAKIGEWGVVRGGSYKFHGLIDETAIFTRALSQQELQAIVSVDSAGMCVPPPPPCAPPPNDIVSWWRAENDATDYVDDNHGVLMNGATFASGRVGQAFNLDGVNDFVRVPDSSLWAFGASPFTVALWVNFDSIRGGAPNMIPNVFVAQDEGGGNTNKWMLYRSSSGLTWHINGPAIGPVFLAAPFSPTTGNWYHVGLTRSGNLHTFFVNGAVIGTVNDSRAIPNVAYDLTIGQAEGYSGSYFDGRIDELSIFQRALSQAEMLSIFLAGSSGMCTNAPPTVTCPVPVSVNCSPPTGVELSLTTHVGDADGDALSVTWMVDNVVVQTDNVPAGGPPTSADVTLDYLFTPGTHDIHVTVDDGANVPVHCGSIVQVAPETEAPQLTCPDEFMAEVGENCLAAVPDVTGLVSASDECTPTGSLVVTQSPPAGTLLGPGTHTLTVTATDGANNSTSCEVPLIISDRLPPALVGLPENQTLECGSIPAAPAVTALDNCDGAVAVSYKEVELPGDCPESVSVIERTWTASDVSGNTRAETRTITLVDTTPPALTVPADISIECGTSIDPSVTGFASAVDGCDATPRITFSDESVAGACAGAVTITRTWTATDECGNEASGVQTITAADTTPPVLGLPDATEGTPNALWHAGGHQGSIPTAIFTPDATHAITGGPEGTVRIWRTADGVLERILYGHTAGITRVRLSLDAQTIYSASHDGTIRAWRTSDGAALGSISTGSPIADMALTPDRAFAVASHYNNNTYTGFLAVWRLSDGALVRTLSSYGGGRVAASPDGLYAASRGVGQSEIHLWRLADGGLERTFALTLTIHALEFSPDSTMLGVATSYLSAGGPNIHLFNVAEGTLLSAFEAAQLVSSLAFAPDGSSLAAGVALSPAERIHIYNPADGSLIRALWRPDSFGSFGMIHPITLEYSADGSQLLSGGGSHPGFLNNSPEDDALDLWDVASGAHIRGITQHRRQVTSVAYSPARNIIASASYDWTIRMHDADTGTPVPPVIGVPGPIHVMSMSADGTRIAAASGAEPRFRVWNALDGSVIRTFEAPHHIIGCCNVGAGGLSLSPNGEYVVSSHNNEARLWSVATGALLHEVSGFNGQPGAVAFSPDNETIAAAGGGSGGHVKLWRASDGVVMHDLPIGCSANAIAFSPDGRFLAVGDGHGAFCGNGLSVFRVEDGVKLYTVPAHPGNVSCVAFSPSGKYIATGSVGLYSSPPEIAIWRATDGSLVNRFTNVGQGVLALAYAADDNRFAFGRYDSALTLATPLPTGIPPADVVVQCGETVPGVPDVFAGDNCDSAPSFNFNESSELGLADIRYVLTRTWTASDACGNDSALMQKVTVRNCRPTAEAGPDQAVDELTLGFPTLVSLDGSASFDLDDSNLTYAWTQVAGPPVALNTSDPVRPVFVAPLVPPAGATLTFQLIASDGRLSSDPDVVNITVKNVNNPPTADAGDDQAVREGVVVTLDGTGSFDPDSDALTYSWAQTGGPSVTLSGATSAQPAFTAPLVTTPGVTLTVELTVSDGVEQATDTVEVLIEDNHDPIADAGADQTVAELAAVSLDGSNSRDPDGDAPLSYSWAQLSGPSVALSNPTSATPSFTAPAVVGVSSVTLVFRLTVEDGHDGSGTDEVTITVLDQNAPPACDLARPSAAFLWPPNHKMVPIIIVGVSDPDNESITITILGVTQDEPTNGLGDGDTAPDAVLQGDRVVLRAERSGLGNGRVYRITFQADDGVGGVCTGSVLVCVPRDRGQGASCTDDGQNYNSLVP